MNLRFQRSVGSSLLAVSLSAAPVACTTYQPIPSASRPHDRIVETCHQSVRAQLSYRFGRSARAGFDTPETYYVSSALQGVRGGGVIAAGGDRSRIHYDCAVNIRSGRVVRVDHRLIERPPMTDVEALQLCQGAIEDEVEADRGRGVKVSFQKNDTYTISRFEKGVRGKAKLKSGDERDRIAYECTLNTRRERVTAAHYRPLEGSRPSWERIVDLCQMVTREMAVADHGRRAALEFDSAETFAVSERETEVRGSGLLRVRGDRDPIRYRCSVDLRKLKVTDARYRPIERPPEATERTVDLCHAELRERITSDREDRVSLKLETSETFFVSHAVEGVRGKGVVRAGRHDRDRIRYECEVNIRRGRVDEARYRYR